MGRGGKLNLNRNKKRRIFNEDKGSDDSDDDYVLEEDQESNGSEDLCASADNASEESFDFEAVEVSSGGEDEVVKQKRVVRSKRSKLKKDSLDRKRTRVRKESKKTSVSDDDDDDDDDDEEEYCEFDDEDDEEFAPDWIDEKQKVVRSKSSKLKENSLDRKRTRVRQPSKKTSVSDDDEEEYCDFDDEDDEDDEEFAPDGIDFVDEEEEFQVKKKRKKATQHVSRKKVSVKGRKRKRKTKVSKKPLKKKQRGILGVRKPGSSSDEDFVDAIRVVRDKCRKKTRKRNKRMVTDWDSDSACSESSDLEYTISEEEKESLAEAKKFCGELKTCLRNSSPLKRSQLDGAPSCQQQKPMGRKGKATISDLQNDTGKQVCGICLSEEGNGIVQGTLNCCSHYFCFACIMEWSKVESRCPLCKQRFVRITRAPRSDIGIDLRTSVIQVPTRDQVYRPSEEEVRGYFDPYENVVCIECHQGGDDSLMLLCDICDSPAHTYCVGLQREVPEGNWYCEGCRVSEAGSSNMQVRDPVVDHGSDNCSLPTSLPTTRGINSEDLIPPSQYSVSIPEPSFSHGFGNLQPPRYLVRDVHASSPSGAGASTLSGRRRVHRQVHDRFSSNRENQMAVMVARSTALSHIDLNSEVNFESEQCEERTAHHAGTLLSNGFNSAFEELVQDREPLSTILSLSHLRQVVNQGTSTAITSGSAHVTLPSEREGTNLLLGSEQFHQCSIRSDDSISPHTYRDSSCFHGESAK
ncbi:zinc finger protein [Macleaya cordata]|uniref:Zinc finger protein n=1 Tax=Macleaya cordata TaxID=56857 RepID=A0A200PWL1_MACCD|nr:zinc finger protein [Macleaya cordata]